MERPRRRRRLLAAAVTAAVGLLAGAQAVLPTPALAAGASSPTSQGCGPVSCTFDRTGQSLFHVPVGVTLLQVDVIGAGASAPARAAAGSHTTPTTATPGKDAAVEVQGNLALSPGVTALEVVVGGQDTLGGTTSEIMTSTDEASQVLVAADGVAVRPAATKAGKSTRHHTSVKGATTHAKTIHAKTSKGESSKGEKKAAQPSSGVNRLVATPNRVPAGGSLTAATGPAKVVIRWRAPWQTPQIVSSRRPTLTAGTSSTFMVRAIAATVPTLRELGDLPLGLTFHDQGNGTAALVGVPLVDGVYRLRVLATTGQDPPVTQRVELVVRGGLIRLG